MDSSNNEFKEIVFERFLRGRGNRVFLVENSGPVDRTIPEKWISVLHERVLGQLA